MCPPTAYGIVNIYDIVIYSTSCQLEKQCVLEGTIQSNVQHYLQVSCMVQSSTSSLNTEMDIFTANMVTPSISGSTLCL